MHHFHPSIMHFTRNMLRNEPISFKGDPLQDFSLSKYSSA
jgi:hypothetical protein